MKPLHILVTNARRRKAVPIVRSLGRAGMKVTCAESSRWAAAFYSRHCRGRFVYPAPDSGAFVGAVARWLRSHPCDAIFPLDDDALLALSAERRRLPDPDVLLLPDHETVSRASDKSWLVPYARRLGLAVPATRVVRTQADLADLNGWPLPAVVKRSRGSGSRGVTYAESPEQLAKACRALLADGMPLLVQERIPAAGEGLGYFALYDRRRRLVAQFMHRRLREYPLTGGPSTLREGVWDEALARQARRLLESLGWVGLAMVEFKRDPRDGRPKLMELNPRFWGSVALAIFSGVDFPVLAAHVTAGRPVEPVTTYPPGRRARWLWPGDLLHLSACLRRGRWPKGFFQPADAPTCWDLLSLRDPAPAVALTMTELLRRVPPGRPRRSRPERPGIGPDLRAAAVATGRPRSGRSRVCPAS